MSSQDASFISVNNIFVWLTLYIHRKLRYLTRKPRRVHYLKVSSLCLSYPSTIFCNHTEIDPQMQLVKLLEPLWYRPSLSREDAIKLVSDMSCGGFIMRDSQTVRGGYAFTIKVNEDMVRKRKKLSPGKKWCAWLVIGVCLFVDLFICSLVCYRLFVCVCFNCNFCIISSNNPYKI